MSLVWEENLGSLTLTEMTAVSPSRQSSPERVVSFRPFVRPFASAYFWIARVSVAVYIRVARAGAVLMPSRCVGPSWCLSVFVKEKSVSA